MKGELYRLRQKETNNDTFDLLEREFQQCKEKFSQKKTKIYDFLLKAGKRYQDAMFKLCQQIIQDEDVHDIFRNTVLHMTWKQKGPADILKNNRFIPMIDYLPRTCEALIVRKMKEDILRMFSIYQIGGQKGHFLEEHKNTMKSLMDLQKERCEGVILLLLDIV